MAKEILNVKSDVKTNNECFIIMPISDPAGYESGHFKRIYEDIFKPACEKAKLVPVRSDEVFETNLIHIDILKRLLNSKMAICDLSSHNPNVLFELGIRQAFDMPTVLVQEKGTKPIFDISLLKYCEYRKGLQYKEVLEDQDELAKFLKETQAAYDKGEIVNSLVNLLKIQKANFADTPSNDPSMFLSIILSELTQLKKEFRRNTIPSMPPLTLVNERDNIYYGKIMTSIKQLSEMVKSGVSKNIFDKNYIDLKEQISAISDIEMRAVLQTELDEVKMERDMFLVSI